MNLEGKVVVITGAADPSGIGAAIAKGFFEARSKIVVGDIVDGNEVVESIEKAGGEALFVKTDVTDQDACCELAKAAVDRFGTIDVLVNNAAIYADIVLKTLMDTTTAEWQRILNVNLIGPFHCTKAVFPYLQEKGGKIINISSDSVHLVPPGMPHYVASKGGVMALTRCLARELGMFNINVNTLCPGFSASGASKKLFDNAVLPIQGLADQVVQMRCIQREQETRDVVGAALYLASSHSDFMTGQVLVVNGGASFQ